MMMTLTMAMALIIGLFQFYFGMAALSALLTLAAYAITDYITWR